MVILFNSQLPRAQLPTNQQSEISNHKLIPNQQSRNLQCCACSGADCSASRSVESSARFSCLATGWLVQRVALGVDDAGMRMRVEAEVRSAFDRMAQQAPRHGGADSDLPTIRAALDGDTSAVRRLLTSTAAVVSEDAPFDPALTIYGDDGEPLAWAGRPSDLPSGSSAGRRGVVRVTERLGLAPDVRAPGHGQRRPRGDHRRRAPGDARPGCDAAVASAAFRDRTPTPSASRPGLRKSRCNSAMRASPQRDGATTFAIEDPAGNRLLTATIDSDDLAATRARWQAATESAAIIVLAVAVLLLTGPLVDWRNRARSVRPVRHGSALDVCGGRDCPHHPARRIAGGLVGRCGLFRRRVRLASVAACC